MATHVSTPKSKIAFTNIFSTDSFISTTVQAATTASHYEDTVIFHSVLSPFSVTLQSYSITRTAGHKMEIIMTMALGSQQ
jgi:hypothetical protein